MRPNKKLGDSRLVASYSEHFDRRGRVVQIWRIRSAELREAARLVWQGGWIQPLGEDGSIAEPPELYGIQELYRPAQLLMGLCLEVALKGLLVERDQALINQGKLAKKLSTHSLENLFKAARIPLKDTEEELNLVRKLSDAVEWVSKYPIPLKACHLTNPKHKSRGTLSRIDTDFEWFEELWKRIDGEFKTPVSRRGRGADG